MNIELPPHIQDLMEEVWPDRTPRRRASEARKLLYTALRERLIQQQAISTPLINAQTGMKEPDQDAPKVIADRIADKAPAIDDQNWVAIRNGVEASRERALWSPENERRLVEHLNVDFDNARNEYRVQKSRITAYFDRLL